MNHAPHCAFCGGNDDPCGVAMDGEIYRCVDNGECLRIMRETMGRVAYRPDGTRIKFGDRRMYLDFGA